MARKALSRLKRDPGDRCQPPPTSLQYPPCNNVGNDVITCYPLANTTLQQDTWTKVIWNLNHPKLTQFGRIDVYLLSFDTQDVLASWKDQPTSQGQVSSCTDDAWFASAGANAFDGKAVPWHFQWLLVQAGTTITGGEPKETRFTVMQTRPLDSQLDSIDASRSSAAAASSSAASASAASSSAAASGTSDSGLITTTLPDGTPTTIPQGGLQNSASSDAFPHWAIALLAVLGFFALLGFLFFAFFMCRDFRQRRRLKDRARRESMGSESPMMAAIGAPTSPQSPDHTEQGGAGAAPLGRGSFPRSYVGQDASSTTSHTDSGLITGADAMFIANAFRDTLRRPDFKDRPLEEGESPDALPEKPTDPVISRELAEEGRDIRSVHSVRGVKVESLIDHEHDS